MWPCQIFVNDLHNFKCVLFIYSTICFQPNYQLLTEEEKSRKRSVSFFCEEKDDDLVMSLIQHHVPWSSVPTIAFSVIPHRFSSRIEDFIQKNNLGKCSYHTFYQMELNKETFLEKTKNITSTFSSGN